MRQLFDSLFKKWSKKEKKRKGLKEAEKEAAVSHSPDPQSAPSSSTWENTQQYQPQQQSYSLTCDKLAVVLNSAGVSMENSSSYSFGPKTGHDVAAALFTEHSNVFPAVAVPQRIIEYSNSGPQDFKAKALNVQQNSGNLTSSQDAGIQHSKPAKDKRAQENLTPTVLDSPQARPQVPAQPSTRENLSTQAPGEEAGPSTSAYHGPLTQTLLNQHTAAVDSSAAKSGKTEKKHVVLRKWMDEADFTVAPQGEALSCVEEESVAANGDYAGQSSTFSDQCISQASQDRSMQNSFGQSSFNYKSGVMGSEQDSSNLQQMSRCTMDSLASVRTNPSRTVPHNNHSFPKPNRSKQSASESFDYAAEPTSTSQQPPNGQPTIAQVLQHSLSAVEMSSAPLPGNQVLPIKKKSKPDAPNDGNRDSAARSEDLHGVLKVPVVNGSVKTKTIAVASHCPEEILTQQWSVDDFNLLRKLYEGNLSVVCQAQHKRSQRSVALKIYKRSRLHEMERFQLAREICLHIRILHPNVVSLYAAWKDSKYVYLALEWAPLGNLFDYLVAQGGRLPEQDAAQIVMKPLLTALAALHSQQFIHRDIKLENILMDASCNIKLGDFGLAIDQKFEQANTRLGTFGYFAPEVLNCPLKKGPFDYKDQTLTGYDSKVDVWSAGVVGYEILTGKAPFSASSAAKIIEAIKTRVLQYPDELSLEARDFLTQALQRDPAARATAKQLLNHAWIIKWCGPPTDSASLEHSMPSMSNQPEITI